jgi:hypothetical protein
MNKNSVQYVNIVKNQQNIKIDYQIVDNNIVIKTEQSIFLLDDKQFSNDTSFKLQTLEDTLPRTYLSGICESSEQKIVSKDIEPSLNEIAVTYDTNHNILLNNDAIQNSKLFHNQGKVDYLFSPFSILQSTIQEELIANSLNILILNDTIYAIVLDKDKRYIYSNTGSLTPYDEIKNSEFYNDEIVEQKLFDEVYLLELTDNISNIIKEFYEKEENSNFIESVNIFFVIKQLNDTQLESLQETLMMDINYNQISLDDALYDIAKRQSVSKYSFITPRKKKTGLPLPAWIAIAVVSTLIAIGALYALMDDEEEIPAQKQAIEKEKPKKIIKSEPVKLNDHNHSNTQTIAFIKNIFDLIDDQSTLKEIQLQKYESTIVYNFKDEFSYEKTLQPELLKLYKKSENILTSKSKNQYNAIISNTGLINKIKHKKIKYNPKETKYLDKTSATNLIKSFFNDKTTIKHKNETKTKYSKSTYLVKTIIKEPVEFYNIFEIVNKQPHSIELNYPIEFVKSEKGIELTLNLAINQNIPETNK